MTDLHTRDRVCAPCPSLATMSFLAQGIGVLTVVGALLLEISFGAGLYPVLTFTVVAFWTTPLVAVGGVLGAVALRREPWRFVPVLSVTLAVAALTQLVPVAWWIIQYQLT